MDDGAKRMLKVVGLVFFVVAILSMAGYFISNSGFRVTSTTPDTSKVSTLTPYFEVVFNKAPDKDSVQVKATPSGIIDKTVIDGKKLRIYTKVPLTKGYSYSIEFSASGSGHRLTKTITFTPQALDFNKLPKEQQTYAVQNQDKGPQSDPIIKFLPHGNLDYTLNYKLAGDQIILEASLLLTGADSRSDTATKEKVVAKYKQEVMDYIKSIKLDPSKYTINYTIVSQ